MSDSVSETPAGSAEAPAAARASEADDNLLILTLRNTVLFPQTVLPITIRSERTIAAAPRRRSNHSARSASCCSGTRRRPIRSSTACYRVGTLASIVRYVTAPDGSAPPDLPGRAALQRAPITPAASPI